MRLPDDSFGIVAMDPSVGGDQARVVGERGCVDDPIGWIAWERSKQRSGEERDLRRYFPPRYVAMGKRPADPGADVRQQAESTEPFESRELPDADGRDGDLTSRVDRRLCSV